MSRETLVSLGRRAVVVVATVCVIGVAVGTVQLAAQWRAENAPLVAAPVSMTSISDAYAAETERADDLANQMGGVAQQVSDLQAALIAANGGVAGGATSATKLQKELAAAKTKLTTIQKQLKAAQGRLVALNQAAARQAAINRAAGARTSSSSRSSGSSSGARSGSAQPTPTPGRTREPGDD